MQSFIEGIKKITNEFVILMNAGRKGQGRKNKKHAPPPIPTIPETFATFVTS
jgi:hypothetical protein